MFIIELSIVDLFLVLLLKYYYFYKLLVKLRFKCKFVGKIEIILSDKVMLFNNKFGFFGFRLEVYI